MPHSVAVINNRNPKHIHSRQEEIQQTLHQLSGATHTGNPVLPPGSERKGNLSQTASLHPY